MSIKVSVVVPVYNPGSHIDDCITSVLGQSLPDEDYEVLFVDDGSTDGTGERLDELEVEHPNMHVIHIPNSGWPGRPRNVGMEAAQGEFVYFVDNDDWLGEEALERMCAMADRNRSDIVIGKVVGDGRRIPREIFRRSVDRASLAEHPLLSMLTPHKLFRRSFLEQHEIRFPEGRRRLEDHVFVMRAYLLADVISILSDYACYYWVRREDETNASRQGFEPRGYYDNVREVLDIVEEHVQPGPFRDSLLRHWYRGKMLGRLGGKKLLSYPPDYQRELFEEIRRLAAERFGPGVVAALPANLRLRSSLLRAGRLDALLALAKVEGEVRASVSLESVEWKDGTLRIACCGQLVHADGTPVAHCRDGDRVRLDVGEYDVPVEDLDVTSELRRARLDVVVKSRESGAEFLVPVKCRVEQRGTGEGVVLILCAEASLDPMDAAANAPLGPGVWDVYARIICTGWDLTTRLGSGDSEQLSKTLSPLVLGVPARSVAPYCTTYGNLSVQVDKPMKAAPSAPQRRDAFSIRVVDRQLLVTLRIPLPTMDRLPEGALRLVRRALNALPPSARSRLADLGHAADPRVQLRRTK